MKNFTLLDEKFDINQTKKYHLSMQLSLNNYSICIFEPESNKYLVAKNYNFTEEFRFNESSGYDTSFCDKIKEILKKDEFLNKPYDSIKFNYLSKKSTLVPNILFEIAKLKSYFTFNNILKEYESINYNKIKHIDAYVIFSVPSFLSTILVNQYKKIKFYHQCRPFIEYITSDEYLKRFPSEGTTVYVDVHKSFFDCYITEGQKLILYNSFSYKNANDFLFFLLNVYAQFGLNTNLTELVLAGDVNLNTELHNQITTYIKKVRFLKLNNKFTYSKMLSELPEHNLVNLYNFYGCE
jgi:hypothetical protein